MHSCFMEWVDRNNACNKIQYGKLCQRLVYNAVFLWPSGRVRRAKYIQSACIHSTLVLASLLKFFTRAFSSAGLDALKNSHNCRVFHPAKPNHIECSLVHLYGISLTKNSLLLFFFLKLCGKNDFAEKFKIWLDTDLKIILLGHQNNFVRILKTMSKQF